MIRMILALSLAIYGTLVIWGQPTTQAASAPASLDTDAAVAAALAFGPGDDRPVILGREGAGAPAVTRAAVSDVVVPSAAAMAAANPAPEVRPIGEPQLVSLIQRPDPASVDAAGSAPAPEGPLLRVSGDRVNMRAGPSTANPVLDSLVAGTLAEALGDPVGGWQEIRVVDTGVTGFMAARFLDPA